ncbi:MAG: CAP domain-containing protein [Propionibacteriaceae bacterium]|nr:CAP domain-containing protein [Propionibacteriaceae bacterium]
MNRHAWLRRAVAAVALSGAATLALAPAAAATPTGAPAAPAEQSRPSWCNIRLAFFEWPRAWCGDQQQDRRLTWKSAPTRGEWTPAPTQTAPAQPAPAATQAAPAQRRMAAPAETAPAEPVAETAPAPSTQAPAAQSDQAARILELTNAERAQAGLAPLTHNDCLADSAQQWSERMSGEQRLYHSNLRDWMGTCELRTAAENVAMGGRTPERTVEMWMNSPGHRANILNPNLTQLGVGWSDSGSYATQQFGG